jgi:TatD DNase family protein
MKLIDIGVNLCDPMFRGIYRGKRVHPDDFSHILQRAKGSNVVQMLITGVNLEGSLEAQELAQEYSFYSTMGFHPTHSSEWNSTSKQTLLQLLRTKTRIAAIGECGLDYDRIEFASKSTQLAVFQEHFDLARETNLPMFFHCRNSYHDFFEIIRANRSSFSTGVVHSFTGRVQDIHEIIDLDLYVSLNGCSMKTLENIRVIKEIPIERIMIETDAPWCDIRPTHASHEYIQTQFESKKKEKFQLGTMVKSRNEPCTLM